MKKTPNELNAISPQVTDIWLSEAINWSEKDGVKKEPIVLLNFKISKPLSKEDTTRLEKWLEARIKPHQTKLIVENTEVNNPKIRRNNQHQKK